MNVRELSHVVSTALQITGVERHAAHLTHDELLPRAGEEVDERDAAVLLLAVAAAPHPDQASQVVENLASLRLENLVQAGTVMRCEDDVRARLPGNALNAVAEALEYGTSDGPGFRIFGFSVQQGGHFAVITSSAGLPGGVPDRRLQYGEGMSFGLEIHAVVTATALAGVAHALHPQIEVGIDQQGQVQSLATH